MAQVLVPFSVLKEPVCPERHLTLLVVPRLGLPVPCWWLLPSRCGLRRIHPERPAPLPMLIVGQRGRYDSQLSTRQRDDQSPNDGTILFRTSDAVIHEQKSKPSLHLEQVQKVLMGQQRARNNRDMCTARVHRGGGCTRKARKFTEPAYITWWVGGLATPFEFGCLITRFHWCLPWPKCSADSTSFCV